MAEAEAAMAEAEAANYDSETRAEERRTLLETFDLALDDSPGRQLSRDGLATVFSILEIVISEHEQQRVFDCYSTDGFFGEKEFLACFMRRYERSELWRVFNEQDREGKRTLFMSEANAAVVSLGNKCKGAEFRKLVKYFNPETRKLDFHRFCLLTSDWALFLSVDDPVEFPEPGKWADTVAEIHSIFSKVCATMLVFVPIVLKANSTKKIPFLSQKDKTPGDNCIDSALAICTSLWALFYLCSFAARGTIFWKLFDGVSLVCALGTTSILMSFVNLYMAVIPLITSVVALASLWLLSQKIVPAGAKANFMRKYFV